MLFMKKELSYPLLYTGMKSSLFMFPPLEKGVYPPLEGNTDCIIINKVILFDALPTRSPRGGATGLGEAGRTGGPAL